MAAITKSAKETVKSFLDQYGLGNLANWAWGVYAQSGGGQTGMDAIIAELPDTPSFKARFPAYEKLAKEGRAMSVNDMLNYEQSAHQIMHSAGIPAGFYDTPDELAQFMLHDVSVAELEARVKDAQSAMISAPQDVRDQLDRLYGVDQGHLTAFFLDPTKAEPILAQKYTAAQIASQASRANVAQLDQAQAEQLAKLGVTDAQAQQGFGQLGTQRGLFEAQAAGEGTIGIDQQLGAVFGGDTAAQLEFQKRAAARKAQFGESSGFGVGQGGVSGLAPQKTA